jgi:hypothetical protein
MKYDTKLFDVQENRIFLHIQTLRKQVNSKNYSTIIEKFLDVTEHVLETSPTFDIYLSAKEIELSDRKYLPFLQELKVVMREKYTESHTKTVIQSCPYLVKIVLVPFLGLFMNTKELKKIVFE